MRKFSAIALLLVVCLSSGCTVVIKSSDCRPKFEQRPKLSPPERCERPDTSASLPGDKDLGRSISLLEVRW
ncbi:MAG: hypothetical protein K2X27_27105 [Candidatus Obscuribacterales bacterium]|nr:hypothetical protein [Candidatus Obscuribacterales bacterium]